MANIFLVIIENRNVFAKKRALCVFDDPFVSKVNAVATAYVTYKSTNIQQTNNAHYNLLIQ